MVRAHEYAGFLRSHEYARRAYFLLVAALSLVIFPGLIYGQGYVQANLTSDGFVTANFIDTDLVNPWGLVQSPTSPFWSSDQATGLSTLHTGAGSKLGLTVTVNTATPPPPPNGPSGVVFNSGTGFVVTSTAKTGASLFLFSDLNGNVYGWNGGMGNTMADVGATVSHGVLTGLAITPTASDIYVSNFTPTGGILEFDSNWKPIATTFVDASLPAGYEPYNVEDINGTLFVAYEPINTTPGPSFGHPLQGLGNGVIAEVVAATGNSYLLKNLITDGNLDDPWGMVIAPSDFGKFSNDLLVGNFGNGTINAYDPMTGAFKGTIETLGGDDITNEGLWALVFGNGSAGTSKNTLYLTAGLNNEQDGLLAEINPIPEPASLLLFGTGLLIVGGIVRRRRAAAHAAL
ncbi:MAG: TIGR03118 family protein [Terriglobia bacterium]